VPGFSGHCMAIYAAAFAETVGRTPWSAAHAHVGLPVDVECAGIAPYLSEGICERDKLAQARDTTNPLCASDRGSDHR
jgi:hypothetical protein